MVTQSYITRAEVLVGTVRRLTLITRGITEEVEPPRKTKRKKKKKRTKEKVCLDLTLRLRSIWTRLISIATTTTTIIIISNIWAIVVTRSSITTPSHPTTAITTTIIIVEALRDWAAAAFSSATYHGVKLVTGATYLRPCPTTRLEVRGNILAVSVDGR